MQSVSQTRLVCYFTLPCSILFFKLPQCGFGTDSERILVTLGGILRRILAFVLLSDRRVVVFIQCSSLSAVCPFAVVEFNGDNKVLVSVVSTAWICDKNSTCAWPTGIGSQQKLINHAVPTEKWVKYPCKVLRYAGKF